jgi:hypothetical protein
MLMLYAKYQEAVISSYWENCYESFSPARRPAARPPVAHHSPYYNPGLHLCNPAKNVLYV